MMKSIAIVIPQLGNGGAEKVASILSIGLSNQYNVHVIVYNEDIQDYEYSGKLISLNAKQRKTIIGKIICFFERANKLRKLKKERLFDTTISFLNSPNLLNILTGGYGTTIVSVRNYSPLSNKGIYGKISDYTIKYLYRRADYIVSVSQLIREKLVENYKIVDDFKNIVIYNPYDLKNIQKMCDETLNNEELQVFCLPVIITVGSLTDQKGQWHLIRAFYEVKKSVPEASLVVLGKGDLSDYLHMLVKDLGLEKDVHFWGFKKNPYKYLFRSTLYAFPSLYEGFPNALCEAMACGLPIIASDCKSGPREILAPNSHLSFQTKEIEFCEYGILTPLCDGVKYEYKSSLTIEELYLAEGIIKLLQDDVMRNLYSQKSKTRVKDFDLEKIVNEWMKII